MADALIHGPDVRNFRVPFRLLDDAGAALPIEDAAGLAAALLSLTEGRHSSAQGPRPGALLAPEASADELVSELTQHMDAAAK